MAESTRAFVIEVMLLEKRWHGHSEWPSSPFRLFQALVAAAARKAELEEGDKQALQWLERLDAPVIAAPRCLGTGQAVQMYVPNNDLDAVGGDPDRVGEIRAPKRTRPRLLQGPSRFLYVWQFVPKDGGVHVQAQRLKALAVRLHQFGRGIDMAFARAHVLLPEEAEEMLRRHPGSRHEPCANGGNRLAIPSPGSLRSLERRFKAFRTRLGAVKEGRKTRMHFRQPPKPLHRMIGYACPPRRFLFDLRRSDEPDAFAVVPQREIAPFTTTLRDMAASKLREAGANAAQMERYLIGRNATAQDKKLRVRIIPLPSIGHEFAGGDIRRVLLEVPQDCPLNAADVFWAFQGEIYDPASGELTDKVLVETQDTSMLRHYGAEQPAILWRSITPVALSARRGGRAGSARLAREEHAIAAVKTALRHADIRAKALRVRVQREPFDRNSHRADTYAPDRFQSQRLWHVEVLFDRPVPGPLVIGNGRYLGLGLMHPVPTSPRDAKGNWRDAFTFELHGSPPRADQMSKLLAVARAALMRLDADSHDDGQACPLFSGHPVNSATPARSGRHEHIFLAVQADAEGRLRWLHVVAPWLADHTPEVQNLRRRQGRHFATIVSRLQVLYGPGLPRETLLRDAGHAEALRSSACHWRTIIPYLSTRRWRSGRGTREAFLREDIRRECARRGLFEPEKIELREIRDAAQGRLWVHADLHFASAQPGIILLGHASHAGQGLFLPSGLWQPIPD